MVIDNKGQIFEDRRKGDRRLDERRKIKLKVEDERRTGEDRRKGDKRK